MSTRATVINILRALESRKPVTVKHHIIGSIQVDDAKPLGFGTSKAMVRFHRGDGWTVIDPLTWEVLP